MLIRYLLADTGKKDEINAKKNSNVFIKKIR